MNPEDNPADDVQQPSSRGEFQKELECTINKWCQENPSNTPDFILAEYMLACLKAFESAVTAREEWYGRKPIPGRIDGDAVPVAEVDSSIQAVKALQEVERLKQVIQAEREEWNKLVGVTHPPDWPPLSPKDVRLMKAIFQED